MLKLKKFPDIPVSTPEEARGSGNRQRSSVSSSKLEMRDPSLLPRERIPDISTHLKRRRAAQERREELMGRATIPRVPQMSQSIPEDPVFPALLRLHAEDRLTPGGTCDNPVGKPRGKASRESHKSLNPSEGKRDTAASAREEIARACPHSRRGLPPLGRLH